MNELTELERGWLAGLMEGEATFVIRTIKGGLYPGVAVKMTDKDVIWRILELTGIGIARGPYKPTYPNAKLQWEWGVYRRPDVADLLVAILPVMGTRRSERIRELLDLALTPYLKCGPLGYVPLDRLDIPDAA